MVLHLLLVRVKPESGAEARRRLAEQFLALHCMHDVKGLGCVIAARPESTHDLALFAHLPDASALERFGTDARYMRFLQRPFLPAVSEFVSMDVALDDSPLPAGCSGATCFCLDVAPATYEWQVRALLSRLAGVPRGAGAVALGMALNERQPYRAGGIVCVPADGLEGVVRSLATMAENEAVTGVIAVAGTLMSP